MRQYTKLLLIFFLTITFGISCEKEESQKDPETDFIEYDDSEGLIGTGGGSLTVADPNSTINGASLNIPEGALSFAKQISIKEVEIPQVFGQVENSIAIKLYPEGQVFEEPVSVEIPYSDQVDPNNLVVWYFNEKDSILQEMIISEINTSNHTILFETNHFSTYYTSLNYVKYEVQIGKWQDKIAATVYLDDSYGVFSFLNNKDLEWVISDYRGILGQVWMTSQFQVTLMKKNFGFGLFDKELLQKDITVFSSHSPSLERYKYNIANGTHGDHYATLTDIIYIGKIEFKENGLRLMSGEPIIFVFDDNNPLNVDDKLYLKIRWRFWAGSEGHAPSYRTTWIETKRERKNDLNAASLADLNVDKNFNQVHDYFEQVNISLPKVSTTEATSITHNSAVVGGIVSDDGGSSILDEGVYLGETDDPVNGGIFISNETTEDKYTMTVDYLNPQTTYYYAAWAENSAGISTGAVKSFTTTTAGNKPEVDFSATPVSISEGEEVQFTDLSTNNPTSWLWDFGDGESSTEQNPSHTYTTAGTYTVGLTSTNSYGSNTETKSEYIAVSDVAKPDMTILDMWSTPSNPKEGEEIELRIKIQNLGATAGPFKTSMRVKGESTDLITINHEGWNSQLILTFVEKEIFNEPGTYEIVGTVDIDNELDEVDETNNTYSFILEVEGNSQTVTDKEGNVYQTVNIGNQTWMAENLRYLPSVSPPTLESYTEPFYYVFDYHGSSVDDAKATSSYITYGALYNWSAAMAGSVSSSSNPSGVQGVCPDGWHLPSIAEWEELAEFISNDNGGYSKTDAAWSNVGDHLKSTTGWNSSGNGTDDYGFSGLAGGNREWNGMFVNQGIVGCWVTTTESDSDIAFGRFLNAESSSFSRDYLYHKERGFSVRCIKD